jgi:hypothetical protein
MAGPQPDHLTSAMAAIADVKQVDRQAVKQVLRRAETLASSEIPLSSSGYVSSAAAGVEIAEAAFEREIAKMAADQAREILRMDKVLRSGLSRFKRELLKPGGAAFLQPEVIELRNAIVALQQQIRYADSRSPQGARDLIPKILESCQQLLDLADAMLAASAREIARQNARREASRVAKEAKAHMPRLPLSDPPPKPKR